MLTEIWIRQAQALWDKFTLQWLTFEKIISSSTPRAIQTTEYIFPNRDFEIVDALKAKSSGDWEWKLKKDVYTDDYLNNKYWFIPPNGESYTMVEDRAVRWMNQFLHDNTALKRVAIVSHDFAIKCLLIHFFQIPNTFIDNLKIGNTCQYIFEITEEGKPTLFHWNI
jgi:phosphoserine phosphatase